MSKNINYFTRAITETLGFTIHYHNKITESTDVQ